MRPKCSPCQSRCEPSLKRWKHSSNSTIRESTQNRKINKLKTQTLILLGDYPENLKIASTIYIPKWCKTSYLHASRLVLGWLPPRQASTRQSGQPRAPVVHKTINRPWTVDNHEKSKNLFFFVCTSRKETLHQKIQQKLLTFEKMKEIQLIRTQPKACKPFQHGHLLLGWLQMIAVAT